MHTKRGCIDRCPVGMLAEVGCLLATGGLENIPQQEIRLPLEDQPWLLPDDVVVLVAVALIVTGRIGWGLLAIPALLPLLMRARSVARAAKNYSRMAGAGASAGTGSGHSSEIETAYVRMILDHNNGEMNGDVIAGRFSGRTLRSMELGEILQLLGEASNDEQSVQVLSAYLDRYHGDEWREQARAGAGAGGAGGQGDMTTEEAYDILGLEAGASDEDIKTAHHELMGKIHPDRVVPPILRPRSIKPRISCLGPERGCN